MNSSVLDTSAVLAFLDDEAGAEEVFRVMRFSSISTVNLAEVYSKLSERGDQGHKAFLAIRTAIDKIVPFTEEQAEIAGALRGPTKHAGLSLGDRACIALAATLGAEIYTADRIWADLDLPCKVHLIR